MPHLTLAGKASSAPAQLRRASPAPRAWSGAAAGGGLATAPSPADTEGPGCGRTPGKSRGDRNFESGRAREGSSPADALLLAAAGREVVYGEKILQPSKRLGRKASEGKASCKARNSRDRISATGNNRPGKRVHHFWVDVLLQDAGEWGGWVPVPPAQPDVEGKGAPRASAPVPRRGQTALGAGSRIHTSTATCSRHRGTMLRWDTRTVASLGGQRHRRGSGKAPPCHGRGCLPPPSISFAQGAHVSLRCPPRGPCRDHQGAPSPAGSRGGAGAGAGGGGTARQPPGVPEAAPKRPEAARLHLKASRLPVLLSPPEANASVRKTAPLRADRGRPCRLPGRTEVRPAGMATLLLFPSSPRRMPDACCKFPSGRRAV